MVLVRLEVLREAEDAEEAVAVNKILTKFETLHITRLFGRFLMEFVKLKIVDKLSLHIPLKLIRKYELYSSKVNFSTVNSF